MAKKKTHDEFVKDLNKVHGEGVYVPLEKYKDANTKIKVRHNCKECNFYEWEIRPSSLLRKQGCPKCYGNAKKTTKEYVSEVENRYKKEYQVLGEYINAKTKILVRHNKCGYEWKVIPYSLLNNGCPKCAGIAKKTTEEFKKEIYDKYGNEYEVLGEYEKNNKDILIKHKCFDGKDYKYKVKPVDILGGQKCPKCYSRYFKKSHEKFIEDVKNKYGTEYEVLGKYNNCKEKILIKHNKCGKTFEMQGNNFLHGQQCPYCKGDRMREKFSKSQEDFEKEVLFIHGNEIIVIGRYINANTKILVKHNSKKCKFYQWETTPSKLLQGNTCPICSNRKIVKGINDIATTHPHLVKYFVNKEDAYKYSYGSDKRIKIKCPDCGNIIKYRIANLSKDNKITCKLCRDGKSYPEKFLIGLLKQLDIEFESEYKPSWTNNKRYDFYIKDNNCIIETHGEQHYEEKTFSSCGGRTLEEEQTNDKYKKEIALQNGIKHYIELDCRESNMEWIKSSILKSELNKLFDLSNIDWKQSAKFANKNIIKEVCDYWNNRKDGETIVDIAETFNIAQTSARNYLKRGNKLGWCEYKKTQEYINNNMIDKIKKVCEYWNNKRENETTVDLGKIFNLNKSTITNYLKRGTELGWCKYDPKEEIRKCGEKSGGYNKRKVEIFKDNQSLGVFSSCSELERQSERLFGVKLLHSAISRVCSNKALQYKGFTFKYVEEDK
ncbi:hypothetical protein ACSW8L_16055 (plasmid) [Clostridium perfringens]